TSDQRAKSEFFIKNNCCATICSRHYSNDSSGILTSNNPALKRAKVMEIEETSNGSHQRKSPVDGRDSVQEETIEENELVDEPGPSRK
ncbi:hypothetical protein PMAYCL1PPCAC_08296, partial [Pristionchus mayeri]